MKTLVIFLVAVASAYGGSGFTHATYFAGLPAGAAVNGSALDSGGNILVSGTIQGPLPAAPAHAFLAKYSPDAQTLLFSEILADSGPDYASKIAVDRSGNIYISGSTAAADFLTTANAWETNLNGASNAGFVMKFDGTGTLIYSTLFYALPNQSTGVTGMAVNSAGEVFLAGQTVGQFPASPGATQPSNPANTFFVLRLSAAGDKLIYSVGGLGGGAIAVDAQSNAYVQGFSFISNGSDVPVTPGSYQTTATFTACSGNFAFVFPCDHQYAAKLDPTGMKLIFCTFVSGSLNDNPSSIAVDADGNIYLGGTTGSEDYPTTAGALQTANHAAIPTALSTDPTNIPFQFVTPLANTGYVTKLSSDGTRLLYSTLLGGSQTDSVTGLALDGNGQLYVSVSSGSPDFPSLPEAPLRCLPNPNSSQPVLLTLDAKGAAITAETLIASPSSGGAILLNPLGGTGLVMTGLYAALVPSLGQDESDAIGCVTDSLDYSAAGPIAPGQLLTVFGSGLGPSAAESYDPSLPVLPTSLGGVEVLVNGQRAPLLYASDGQINFVAPYEVAGLPSVTVQIGSAMRTVPVAAMNPGLATGGITSQPGCQSPYASKVAMVLNADGSTNSCNNPAAFGSTVKLFLNGTGVNKPGGTGANPSGTVALQPEVVDRNGYAIVNASSAQGSPLGVWEVDVRLPLYALGYITLDLTVGGTPVKEQNVTVWMAQ